jgi:hypothetical protein
VQVVRALVAIAVIAAPARADMERVPQILQCRGPSTWAVLTKCVDDAHEGYKLPAKASSKIEYASNGRRDRYMFVQRGDGSWVYATRLYDDKFHVVEPRTVPFAGGDGLWVDIHRVDANGTDLVIHRSALLCPAFGSCMILQYECTHFSRGKAVETFRGKVEFDGPTAHVTGDRSQVGGSC